MRHFLLLKKWLKAFASGRVACFVAMFALLAVCSGCAQSAGDVTTTSGSNTVAGAADAAPQNTSEAEQKADGEGKGSQSVQTDGTVLAEIAVQDYGIIRLELDRSSAPITVDNFVKLAKSGFYDGLTFHRIMDGFMIQGGDPLGNGTGGSSETIKGEFAANGVANGISHVKGTISMARASSMDSASSQFFITVDDATFLDGNYAAFGHVTEGIEVVEKIAKDAKPIDDNGTIPKDQQPVITSVVIAEEG